MATSGNPGKGKSPAKEESPAKGKSLNDEWPKTREEFVKRFWSPGSYGNDLINISIVSLVQITFAEKKSDQRFMASY